MLIQLSQINCVVVLLVLIHHFAPRIGFTCAIKYHLRVVLQAISPWVLLLGAHVIILLLGLSHSKVPLHISASRAWSAVAKYLVALCKQLGLALLGIERVLALQLREVASVHSRHTILNKIDV